MALMLGVEVLDSIRTALGIGENPRHKTIVSQFAFSGLHRSGK